MAESKQAELRFFLAINFPSLYAAIYEAPPPVYWAVIYAYFQLPKPLAGMPLDLMAQSVLQMIERRIKGIPLRGESRPTEVPTNGEPG